MEEETKRRKLEKELFNMVYKWGQVGLQADELCNAFQNTLKELYKTIK